MKKRLNIGLIGFGTVGEAFYEMLQNINLPDTEIKLIGIKNKKSRSLSPTYFTDNIDDIIYNDEIQIVIELIDDADKAFHYVKEALLAGKDVISANKKMIAEKMPELIALQEKTGRTLLYDAAVGGSIPIVKPLNDFYKNNSLKSVSGILNGSSNYILSRIFNNGDSYDNVLLEAQQKGFAESDPSYDVKGYDAKYKLCIVAKHAFNIVAQPENIINFGIDAITDFDVDFAKSNGFKIKLISKIWRVDTHHISAVVMPFFVPEKAVLSQVNDEYNGILIEDKYFGEHFMYGKGAGGFPTAMAVLNDLKALLSGYKYNSQNEDKVSRINDESLIKIYVRYQNSTMLKYFDFNKIISKYEEDYNYLIAEISIENLKKAQAKIEDLNIFIAAY